MQKGGGSQKETEMPPEIYQVDSIPHDWLFPQLDAAMHHGGAGVSKICREFVLLSSAEGCLVLQTTSASLSAGCPTLSQFPDLSARSRSLTDEAFRTVKPFFGDQVSFSPIVLDHPRLK